MNYSFLISKTSFLFLLCLQYGNDHWEIGYRWRMMKRIADFPLLLAFLALQIDNWLLIFDLFVIFKKEFFNRFFNSFHLWQFLHTKRKKSEIRRFDLQFNYRNSLATSFIKISINIVDGFVVNYFCIKVIKFRFFVDLQIINLMWSSFDFGRLFYNLKTVIFNIILLLYC